MKPSRLLLIWLAILLTISIVLGTLQALNFDVPASLLSINWGLLLALFAPTGMFKSASSESTLYCGVWTAML